MPRLFQNSDAALVEPHLYLQQAGVEAAPVDQLVVRAGFRDLSFVEHQDSVCLENGAQSMRDHDCGLAAE